MSKPVWVVAGSDTSGGAGITAAIKTLTAMGVPVATIPTAWTAQNAVRCTAIEYPSARHIHAQFDAVAEMGPPSAIVTGMLGNEEVLNAVSDRLSRESAPLIVDPVLVSSSGAKLLPEEAVSLLVDKLIPKAEVVTPNLPELAFLTGVKIQSRADWMPAGQRLLEKGASHVWIKGGHSAEGDYSADLFLSKDQSIWFGTRRMPLSGTLTHGTGCTLATALGAAYALGYQGIEAALFARMYLNRALRLSKRLEGNERENVFFHGSWPSHVAAADLPLVFSDSETRSPQPFASVDGPLGFYPIVDTAQRVRQLASIGARTIQLRSKRLQGDLLRREADAANRACREYGARFFLNDDWRLAIELGCYGVHLGQEDLQTADVEAIRMAGLRLGMSTHCFEELGRAMAIRPSYVAFGPIYPTKLKAMRFAPQGLERLRFWRSLVDIPLVAIGGLQLESARAVLGTGIDGAAVVNDVLSHGNPQERAIQWGEAWESRGTETSAFH